MRTLVPISAALVVAICACAVEAPVEENSLASGAALHAIDAGVSGGGPSKILIEADEEPPGNNTLDFTHVLLTSVPAAHSATEAINTFDARALAYLEAEACEWGDARKYASGDRTVAFPGERWSKDALAMIAYDGACGNEDDATRTAKVEKLLATFATPGVFLGSTFSFATYKRNGDLDAALKDLVPILFRYRKKLTSGTYQHMLDYLSQVDAGPRTTQFDEIDLDLSDFTALAIALGLSAETALGFLDPALLPLPVAFAADFDHASIPESENHMHMIQSTRFLANELLYANGKGEQFNNVTNGMKAYWLDRLASILRHDFQEYNAKGYTRYSLDAIENLAELTSDREVAIAARAVLDFSAAKYAVSSSLQRRNSPFRRLASNDHDDFLGGTTPTKYGMIDEQACRFGLYAGTTDLYPPNGTGYRIPDACEFVSRQAVGTYRVPPMIVELAQQKGRHPYLQTFAGGWNDIGGAPGNLEVYDNEGPFIIAGGGVPNQSGNDVVIHLRAGPDITFKNSIADDQGIPVPTVVLPTTMPLAGAPAPITDRRQAISIQSGLCIGQGFACGIAPTVPDVLDATNKAVRVNAGNWTFANYGTFFAAVFSANISGQNVGFVEAVPSPPFGAPASAFLSFQLKVLAANGVPANVVTAAAGGAFDVNYNSALGGVIRAHFDSSQPRTYPISALRGLPIPAQNTDTWPLASGVINAARNSAVSVGVYGSSWPSPCSLDLSTSGNPQRIGCDGVPNDYEPPPPPPHSSLAWTHVSVPPSGQSSYLFPPNALVSGGWGSLAEYVCRITMPLGSQVGHFDGTGRCWTSSPSGSSTGSSGVAATDFDVLVYTPAGASDAPMWKPIQNGALPDDRYLAGRDANGTGLEVCRVDTGTAIFPGSLTSTGCWVIVNGLAKPFAAYETLTAVPVSSSPPSHCTPTVVCNGGCGEHPDGCGGMIDCGDCCPAGTHTSPDGGCVQNTCSAIQCNADCRACNGQGGSCSSNHLCVCTSKAYCS